MEEQKMVNYGYHCEGWSYPQKKELAMALQKLCDENPDSYGMHPYIEIDEEGGAYVGVRIRRITHLPNNEDQKFEQKADEIYHQVKTNLKI